MLFNLLLRFPFLFYFLCFGNQLYVYSLTLSSMYRNIYWIMLEHCIIKLMKNIYSVCSRWLYLSFFIKVYYFNMNSYIKVCGKCIPVSTLFSFGTLFVVRLFNNSDNSLVITLNQNALWVLGNRCAVGASAVCWHILQKGHIIHLHSIKCLSRLQMRRL